MPGEEGEAAPAGEIGIGLVAACALIARFVLAAQDAMSNRA
jgi:hypothetical protein